MTKTEKLINKGSPYTGNLRDSAINDRIVVSYPHWLDTVDCI